MKSKDFEIRTKIIQETFNDHRTILKSVQNDELNLDKKIYQGGDIFLTEDGEFVDLEFQIKDFTESELVKYSELAEEIYEKFKKPISIYILCPNDIDVCVKECEIISDAVFTIKLACIPEDPVKIILDSIKEKLENNESLDEDDIYVLKMLQIMCKKEERNYYRHEYLKIINKTHY